MLLLLCWLLNILAYAFLVDGVFLHFGAEFGERLLLGNKLAINSLLSSQRTLS